MIISIKKQFIASRIQGLMIEQTNLKLRNNYQFHLSNSADVQLQIQSTIN
ncbi:hypothetical protein pb186bvf_001273 [Paramecium bursaria]